MANACLGAMGNPPTALYQGKRALLSYFRQSPLPKITLRERIIAKLCCGLLGHYIIILYLYCKLLYYNKSTLTNSFKSHTECFYILIVFILCNYIKKSTVCQRFYPAKTIAQNFCNYFCSSLLPLSNDL